MIRLVACDLDETLLDDEKNIPLRNREAIAAFEAQVGIFVPCTGRIYTGLDRTLKQLGADGKAGHYVSSTNGALIPENTGRICASQGVDPQKALELTRYARENGMGIELFTGEGIIYYEKIDALEEEQLLRVSLELSYEALWNGSRFRILEWRTESTHQWESDESLPLLDEDALSDMLMEE